MTDDIVARLHAMRLGDEIMVDDERAIHQAADEIERLRQLVAHQSVLLDTYKDSLKAVRGE